LNASMSCLSSFERTSSSSSDDGEEVTPVPIPNTEVKLFSADGSWGIPPARVGRRWAKAVTELIGGGFFMVSKEKG
jgi:hypothetical protein